MTADGRAGVAENLFNEAEAGGQADLELAAVVGERCLHGEAQLRGELLWATRHIRHRRRRLLHHRNGAGASAARRRRAQPQAKSKKGDDHCHARSAREIPPAVKFGIVAAVLGMGLRSMVFAMGPPATTHK